MINIKHCIAKCLGVGLLVSIPTLGITNDKNIAIYYANNPPVEMLSQFERVIVEADNIEADELTQIRKQGSNVFAYASIGEVSATRSWYGQIKKEWILGKNVAWDSDVMDLSNPEWQEFLISTVITPLWDKGYRGLFLDTLDSFKLFAVSEEKNANKTTELQNFLKRVKKQYPELKLIANRGFEIIPHIAKQLDAVAAESLYASWDNVHKKYTKTSPKNQKWLLKQLVSIKKNYGLDIIIIDYVPPKQRQYAHEISKKIQDQGFIPWVSTPELNYLGVSSITIKPNKILALYDSKIDGHDKKKVMQKYFKDTQGKLELHDIQLGLPNAILAGQYTAVITSSKPTEKQSYYRDWLARQIQSGLTVKMAKISS
jgi:uncharacterized protein (TIGR01370 family)